MEPREELRHHSSFKMGGKAKHLVEVSSVGELSKAFETARELKLPVHILGGGTNTVFHDQEVSKFVIKVNIPGIEVISDSDTSRILKVGAGVRWDDVVVYAVEHGLSGIEAMSAIPGSTGAAPVQNIGAYGQEVKDVIMGVDALDTEALGEDMYVSLPNTACRFSYRDSIFKHMPGKYIITYVTFEFLKTPPKLPNYPGVKEYFEKHALNLENPSLTDIRNAIIEIRKSKLPDPSIVPNCGSFFKNAIVCKEHFEGLKEKYPTIPNFPIEGIHDGKELVKIPTGWLLEQAGFKNWTSGNFKTHDKNALVMTHVGTGTLDELNATVKEIQSKIQEMFGIDIEMEVNIVE